MFVLIWATLFFSVRGSNADTGSFPGEEKVCQQGSYCITLKKTEITAEAGLCVVIPCSFTTADTFSVQRVIWCKIDLSTQKCSESDPFTIFNSDESKNVHSAFKGRVFLLEPDVRKKNCSIIINDLTESDSGSYQLRVISHPTSGKEDGFTFTSTATIRVTGLIQKPTVLIPPLTEGQQTTLTCTAPGLCSGSDPNITWTWRGAGEKDSHITGNITAFKTETVTQRHSSTLTFNPSAEHHGTKVTCKVIFTGNRTTEETVTLNVTYMKKPVITGNKSVREGETLNLTCSVESFPPSLITWTKVSDDNMQTGAETNLQSDTFSDLYNNTESFLKEQRQIGTFSISNVTTGDSGQYICTSKHLNKTWTEKFDVTVIYMRKPVISGNTTVEKGAALNLTCSVESFPPSHLTWSLLGFNTNLHAGPDTDLQNVTGSATLFLSNVTAEHTGQYVCTAQHLNTTVAVFADVTVTWFSKILNNSGCEVQSEVLTCVCISEGFPLPTIRWLLLKNHTEYSVINTVSKHTVSSSITLTVKEHSSTSVECVSSNGNGEAKENLTIHKKTSEKEGQSEELLTIISRPEVIVSFFIGVLLSAVLCYLAAKCHRNKQKIVGNVDETLEMTTSREDPLIDGPKDLKYATIDFSVLKRKCPSEAAKKQESTETEYAEVKIQVKEEREDPGEEEGEVLEEEEEAMIVEDEETKHCVPEEEEGKDEAVYSNVKDIMGENED